jgi:predicted DNA-binding transcriptional regulator AlpA
MPDIMPDRLWTIRELAAYLGYQESSVVSLVNKNPERLPPRVAALGRVRWEPNTVKAWAVSQSRPVGKIGRPRIVTKT